MKFRHALLGSALLAAAPLFATTAAAAEPPQIVVSQLDGIVADNPLEAGGPTAKVIARSQAGDSELQVLVMSRIRLHHHDQEDHIVYVARGRGTARLENAAGEIETRPVAPGDILNLPRGLKHAFEKDSDEDIVLLVVATAGWKPLEDTVFHE
ncbi:MAG TPA: cupin domain-containing protein [Rhodocyclaceae bacterium]|nr:cupin domain-containing protein [Rhodocyclaceae bacterium]